MIADNILLAAKPYLEGHTVTDIVVGIALIAVELDHDKVGVSYMLRDGLPSGCGSFSFVKESLGKPALEVAQLLKTGTDNAQRGLACAVLDAASLYKDLEFCDTSKTPFGITIHEGDKVAMIGYMAPVAKQFAGKIDSLTVFDMGMEANGSDEVCPIAKQPEVLAQADIIIASGTTSINGTLDNLLSMAKNCREFVLIGTSTPMFPEAFENTGITSLGGCWWDSKEKEQIFRNISLGAGIKANKQYRRNKCVRVAGAPTA